MTRPHLVNNVVFFSPGSSDDRRRPFAWNLLKDTLPDERYQVAEAVTTAFGSIYKQFWGPQSAMLLRTAVHANLNFGGSTLLGCLAMLSNDAYRRQVRQRIKDQGVRAWWEEFERWPDQQKRNATAPLQNKLGALLSSWPLRNILCQTRNKLVVDDVFTGKILIVELIRAHLGSNEAVKLFGSLLLHDLMRAGLHQGSALQSKCLVYLNNAAAFAPEVIEELVVGSDSPFSVALATTHLDRLETSLERTLLSACGTMLASRSSYADAETFYKHFGELRMKEREFVGMAWNDLAVKPWAGRTGASSSSSRTSSLPSGAKQGPLLRGRSIATVPHAPKLSARSVPGLGSGLPTSGPPLPRLAASGRGKPHGCAPYGRPASWRSGPCHGACGRPRRVPCRCGAPALSWPVYRPRVNPCSFCGGVSRQCSPPRQASGAGLVAAALPRDYNSRGEHRPIGRAQPAPPATAIAGASRVFDKRHG